MAKARKKSSKPVRRKTIVMRNTKTQTNLELLNRLKKNIL
jgi:hypothetical protein